MNTLISTFHFLLHNYTAHLSNVLKLSRRFAPQRNIYYAKNIKSTNFILGTNTKSTNLRIQELVIFNQTMKIDAHKEKYFHSTVKPV
jgi:putative component of membrane protein insertase Oxa1/YidC/SpoIIIJ protein YidD